LRKSWVGLIELNHADHPDESLQIHHYPGAVIICRVNYLVLQVCPSNT